MDAHRAGPPSRPRVPLHQTARPQPLALAPAPPGSGRPSEAQSLAAQTSPPAASWRASTRARSSRRGTWGRRPPSSCCSREVCWVVGGWAVREAGQSRRGSTTWSSRCSSWAEHAAPTAALHTSHPPQTPSTLLLMLPQHTPPPAHRSMGSSALAASSSSSVYSSTSLIFCSIVIGSMMNTGTLSRLSTSAPIYSLTAVMFHMLLLAWREERGGRVLDVGVCFCLMSRRVPLFWTRSACRTPQEPLFSAAAAAPACAAQHRRLHHQLLCTNIQRANWQPNRCTNARAPPEWRRRHEGAACRRWAPCWGQCPPFPCWAPPQTYGIVVRTWQARSSTKPARVNPKSMAPAQHDSADCPRCTSNAWYATSTQNWANQGRPCPSLQLANQHCLSHFALAAAASASSCTRGA